MCRMRICGRNIPLRRWMTDLKITEEFARDDKIELSDDDKELLKGMGIKVED